MTINPITIYQSPWPRPISCQTPPPSCWGLTPPWYALIRLKPLAASDPHGQNSTNWPRRRLTGESTEIAQTRERPKNERSYNGEEIYKEFKNWMLKVIGHLVPAIWQLDSWAFIRGWHMCQQRLSPDLLTIIKEEQNTKLFLNKLKRFTLENVKLQQLVTVMYLILWGNKLLLHIILVFLLVFAPPYNQPLNSLHINIFGE